MSFSGEPLVRSAVIRPAEIWLLVRTLAECLQAATAVLTESAQPPANRGK